MSEAFVKVQSMLVSALPWSHQDSGPFAISVENCGPRERRGEDRWAVRWLGRCLSVSNKWDWEQTNSSRPDEWLDQHRFNDRDEAIARAMTQAPRLMLNGMTPAQVLERFPEQSVST
jgi:hypothetical protein